MNGCVLYEARRCERLSPASLFFEPTKRLDDKADYGSIHWAFFLAAVAFPKAKTRYSTRLYTVEWNETRHHFSSHVFSIS